MNVSPAEQLFETWRRRVGIVLAPLLFMLTFWLAGSVMVGDRPLSAEGRRLAAVLAAVGVLWVTETLPLPVTALLGAILCVALGVAPAKQVLAYFADPIVFTFIGSFMLARAMSVHQLDRRIALGFLSMRWIGGRPARVLAGMGIVTAVLSMWVSNTATTAMMLPIGLGILGAMHRGTDPISARSWPFATGMMLMIAYAASIGGIGTPVGSPPNLIGIGLIKSATGREIGFLTWMQLCVPLLAAMGVVLFVLLYRLHPSTGQVADPDSMHRYVRDERAKLGPWSWGQVNTLIAFGVAIVLWILPGLLAPSIWGDDPAFKPMLDAGRWMKTRLDEPIVAMVAAVLLFILPTNAREGSFTLSWDQAVRIDWGTILLFGGGLALGTLMIETKVAEALGKSLTGLLGISSLWGLTGLSIALGIILSETTSNTAAANMIIPVVLTVSSGAEVSPIPPALGACLGASYGFMLPVSTPPNAIVYGSGLVSIPSMVRAGIIFDIIGFFIIWGGLRIMCPLLGLA